MIAEPSPIQDGSGPRTTEAFARTPPHRKPTPTNVKPLSKDGPLVIGRYEVVRRIGRGGMGTVFLALLKGDMGFERQVALKVLRQIHAQDKSAIKTLFHEAYLGSLLHHPNVVRALDLGTHQEQPFMVMDYVQGTSLADICKAVAIPAHIALPMFAGILSGLNALHTLTNAGGEAVNAIHCDISPFNLIVGDDGLCRVIDLSSAKSHIVPAQGNHTEGRLEYLPPERVLGNEFDQRADLFSVGVVFYEALTGKNPFAAPHQDTVIANITQRPARPPSEVGGSALARFDDFCGRALAQDPRHRFQSAALMLQALCDLTAPRGRWANGPEIAHWIGTLDLHPQNVQVADQAPDDEQGGPLLTPSPIAVGPIATPTPAPVVQDNAARQKLLATSAAVLTAVLLALGLLFPEKLSQMFARRRPYVPAQSVTPAVDVNAPSPLEGSRDAGAPRPGQIRDPAPPILPDTP